jgi:cobalt-zinc-cadmium efflux system outer membrane protein
MRPPFSLLIVIAPLAVAACTTVPPAPLAPERTAAAWRARTLDDPALRAYVGEVLGAGAAWPPAQWDPRSLAVAALWFSSDVDAAVARARAAGAAIRTAARIPNPSFSFAPHRVPNAGPGIPPWFLSTSLVQLIGVANKRQHRIDIAEAGAEEARLKAVATARTTETAVNSALVAVSAARRRTELLSEQSRIQAEIAEIAEKRVAAGIASRVELTNARTAFSRSEADRLATERATADARYRLAGAVSLPVEAIPFERIGTPPELDDAVAKSFDALAERAREAAVLGRADLMAALASYASAEAALRLELAKQYPDLEFGPSYEYDLGDHKVGVSLGVVLPVFDHNEGPIAEAKAKREETAARFLALQSGAISGAERAVAALREADTALGTARTLAEQLRSRMRSAEALYRRGESDRPSFLAARIELAAAQIVEIDAVAARAEARLALEAAAGEAASELDLGRAVAAKAEGMGR